MRAFPSPSASVASRLLRGAAILWLAAGLFAVAPDLRAQATGSMTIVASFDVTNGKYPYGALTVGTDGNLYGITPSGGALLQGAIFRATPAGEITRLYSFGSASDGYGPAGRLLLASDGNFYGVTQKGGHSMSSGSQTIYGDGTVYRLTPDGAFSVVHTFFKDAGLQGQASADGVIQGNDGALYGTTLYGPPYGPNGSRFGNNDGTVFRLTLDDAYTPLHRFDFTLTGSGGYGPHSPLVQGRDGNFYGVTAEGGSSRYYANGAGAVYKMAPDGTVTNLHSFDGPDGLTPIPPLVEDEDGVFYGTTSNGGAYGQGTFFSVTSSGVTTVIHHFVTSGGEGLPRSAPVRAADGNFYMTTEYGRKGSGSVIQITPAGVVTTVYEFKGYQQGMFPIGALVQADDGSFYGTTQFGGANGVGMVFRLVVTPHPPFFNGEIDLGGNVEYLAFPNGKVFGYYSFLADPHYIYHYDLGFEYVFDADDGNGGVYLYDFKSNDFFYTSPSFGFPYLYDFGLQAFLYYYPDPKNPGRYNTNGIRYFYNFSTRKVIMK